MPGVRVPVMAFVGAVVLPLAFAVAHIVSMGRFATMEFGGVMPMRPGVVMVLAGLFSQHITQHAARGGTSERRQRIAFREDGTCSGTDTRAKNGICGLAVRRHRRVDCGNGQSQ